MQVGKLRNGVVFCNVGQGDMAIIMDGYWQMVIDTGKNDGKGRECWDRNVVWWDRKIEVILITHDDTDHSGGINQLTAGLTVDKLITDGSYKIGSVNPGEWVVLSTGDKVKHRAIELEVLDNPKNRQSKKDTGLIAKVTNKNTNYWFMADADTETEQRLAWTRPQLRSFGGQMILKVSHHGSPNGTSETLLEAINPTEAVVSVGKNNYGHPSGQVIERLETYGVKVRRTDIEGDIKYASIINNRY